MIIAARYQLGQFDLVVPRPTSQSDSHEVGNQPQPNNIGAIVGGTIGFLFFIGVVVTSVLIYYDEVRGWSPFQ